MKWVLIIIILGGNHSSIATHEFNEKFDCEGAALSVEIATLNAEEKVVAKCLPKGDRW